MILKIILLVTALLAALISGFFYSFVCSVNPGLSKLTDPEYLRAMLSINRAVLNPLFFTSFFGCLVMFPCSTWMVYMNEGFSDNYYLMLSSTILYIAGVFLITGRGNVPLNEALDKINLEAASQAALQHYRKAFEAPWNRYNLIRTVASSGALVFVLATLLRIK